MPGPPPTPTRLKLLRGNPGKRKTNKREPKPRAVLRVPKPPADLGTVAKREWRRVARQLVKLGLLSTVDLSLLGIYCAEIQKYREAQAFIRENGTSYVIRDKDGAVKYVAQFPQVGIARGAADLARKLAAEFGFSPASRSRIQITEKETVVDPVTALRNEAKSRA